MTFLACQRCFQAFQLTGMNNLTVSLNGSVGRASARHPDSIPGHPHVHWRRVQANTICVADIRESALCWSLVHHYQIYVNKAFVKWAWSWSRRPPWKVGAAPMLSMTGDSVNQLIATLRCCPSRVVTGTSVSDMSVSVCSNDLIRET